MAQILNLYGMSLIYFKPTTREKSLILLFAAFATVMSGFFPNETTVYYATTMGCELGCEVAGKGYPFAYIADIPYLSPVSSADWIGALLGVDQFFPYWLALDFLVFIILSIAFFYGLWRFAERLNLGSGRRLLAITSRIFNALLIVVVLNLVFLALGVVTGMLFIPYSWVVLLLSLVFLFWRAYKIIRKEPAVEKTVSCIADSTPSSYSTFARRFGITSLFVLATLILFPFLWLRGGLFQEPMATAISTVQLELSGKGWVADDESRRSIIKTSAFQMYLTHLEFDGWKKVDQMGSGYLFKRGGEKAMLVCRQYSTRYRICSGGPTKKI